MKILALILARGGSKGIPQKNIKKFCGKPLIQWTVKQALETSQFSRVVVSTDSQEIRDIAKESGAEAPFLRPAHLATDLSPSIDSVIHCLDYFKNDGIDFDIVALLEPTSPLRKRFQLEEIVNRFIRLSSNFDSLITIGEVKESVDLLKTIDGDEIKPYQGGEHSTARRQDIEKTYFPYGVAYLTKTEALREQKTFYTSRCTYFMLDEDQCFEIDDPIDFLINETVFKKYYFN